MEENQTQESKSGMNPGLIIAALVVVGLIGGGLWMMNNKSQKTAVHTEDMQMEKTETTTTSDTTQPTAMTDGASSSPAQMTDDSSVKVVAVEAGSFYFKPNEIHVKKGQKVKIVMTSKDMMHDFTIDALNVKMPVTKAGNTGTVEFTADTAGTFEIYCSVGQHKKMGQVGKLIVE